ncbi:MAG: FecR domain-containing protein, partial [Gammaproteobacteria bacterium]
MLFSGESLAMACWRRSLLCALILGGLLLSLPGPAPAQSPAPNPGPTCEPWAARLISYQGTISSRRASGIQLASVALNDAFCVGDVLEIGNFSRAAIQLPDQTVVRLDQGTVITFTAPQDEKRTWLEILKGVIHVISRDPRALRVITPFANAGIEGTEFLVQVGADSATVLVFEGRVKVQNASGAATAGSGESVLARAGSAPVLQQVVRPRDQVVWTLYYPPTGSGALPEADAAGVPTADFYVGRAEQRLAVGRATEAEADLNEALKLEPDSAEVLARQSVIALTRNDAAAATELADRAVATAPGSVSARLAQSYARQSAAD